MADDGSTKLRVPLEEARRLGLKFYWSGVPCKKGHADLRYTGCLKCKACSQDQSKDWYSDKDRARKKTAGWRSTNPERNKENRIKYQAKNEKRIKEQQRAWSEANPHKRKKYYRDWYWRNADEQRVRSNKWRSENLGIAAANSRNRRARERNNGGTHTADDVADILKLQKRKCACCRVRLGKKYHVDHIIPLIKGGSNDRRNLQILCATCNHTKHAKDPIDFMQERGMML